MNKRYTHTCGRCNPKKGKKPCTIYLISKTKGIKLRCICGHIKNRYTKKPLVPWNPQKNLSKLEGQKQIKSKEIKQNGKRR